MYAEERHQAIAELVSARGRVGVTELATQFAVTPETVRRDLSALEQLKLLRRVHGGAVSLDSVTRVEARLSDRDRANSDAKDRIARRAIDLLPDGDCTLMIDAGSTTARFAALLPPSRNWTVITHAVPIAAALAPLAHIELHLLPGRVRATTLAAVGQVTVDALRNFRADIALLGSNGITVGHGLSTPDADEAAAKRAMLKNAQLVVALADASKFGQERTVRFASLEEIDVLVTDSGADPRDVAAFETAGVGVVTA